MKDNYLKYLIWLVILAVGIVIGVYLPGFFAETPAL